jgi:hypothetical protein
MAGKSSLDSITVSHWSKLLDVLTYSGGEDLTQPLLSSDPQGCNERRLIGSNFL